MSNLELVLMSILAAVLMYHNRRKPEDRVTNSKLPLYDAYLTSASLLQYREVPVVAEPVAVAAAPEPEPDVPPVFFKPGEPSSFEEYDGQEHIIEYLRDAVRGLAPDEHHIEPQMFLGIAGMGKTLLAKIVANELVWLATRRGRPAPQFVEMFPADIPDVAALDDVLRRIQEHPGSVLFVDEVHDLTEKHSRKLYLFLEEGRYKFEGEPFPVALPGTTILAATTDYGNLHPAVKRRFIRHTMKPATEQQLLGYVTRRAFPIDLDAAQLIIGRTKFSGAPWEALEIYRMAVTSAKGRQAPTVQVADVHRIFTLQEIDELGLRWLDREVIRALLTQPKHRRGSGGVPEFVCYGASEANVCTLARLDKAEYRESIRARLMSRGLLQVRPHYGQALTMKAVELYRHLKA